MMRGTRPNGRVQLGWYRGARAGRASSPSCVFSQHEENERGVPQGPDRRAQWKREDGRAVSTGVSEARRRRTRLLEEGSHLRGERLRAPGRKEWRERVRLL